jgi:tryptophan synthase beta chain
MSEDSKFFLKDSDVPKQWYNLVADLKEPMSPPLHPGTKQPIGPDDLAPLFPYGTNHARSLSRSIY